MVGVVNNIIAINFSKMACIIIHGGCGMALRKERFSKAVNMCEIAVKAGYDVLCNGGSSIDAAETAVKVLEDDPLFNAGRGSVVNRDGDIEMDAMIVEGKDLKMGSVAAVKGVANPISLARLVMEKTEHTMLIGDGAKQLATEYGIPHVTDEYLNTKNISEASTLMDKSDTVGAVARDKYGNIASATSTGGITLKRAGRVGDSPIIGCGGIADNTKGGVSTTGHGESITRVTLANRVLSLLNTLPVNEAIEQSLHYMSSKTNGRGGIILITNNGEIGKGFSTEAMVWASIDCNGLLESSR